MARKPTLPLLANVPSTRNRCCPKHILFPSVNYPTLLRTQADRRGVFDYVIETGAAVVIPKKLNSVCDAMNWVHAHCPDYRTPFCQLFATSSKDTGQGWIQFLEVVAKKQPSFASGPMEGLKNARIMLSPSGAPGMFANDSAWNAKLETVVLSLSNVLTKQENLSVPK